MSCSYDAIHLSPHANERVKTILQAAHRHEDCYHPLFQCVHDSIAALIVANAMATESIKEQYKVAIECQCESCNKSLEHYLGIVSGLSSMHTMLASAADFIDTASDSFLPMLDDEAMERRFKEYMSVQEKKHLARSYKQTTDKETNHG